MTRTRARKSTAPENATRKPDPTAATLLSGLGAVLGAVHCERREQDAKFAEQNHPDGTADADSIERAIRARETCEQAARLGTLTWADILQEEVAEALAEDDPAALRAELVQVAAVAVAWIEAIDRRTVRRVEAALTHLRAHPDPRIAAFGERMTAKWGTR
ncbi:hypothetical protein GCM10023205_52510 [Yinghuangia aomiensis]|uniref:Uncharacterized protein n=1 Tax=Yinghuangia aomiensis TaxID=676205 RepID=A0ABP9HT97_9ACTN